MIASPKNFIEQFQNFIEHIAGVMKTFLTKEVADNYYLGKTAKAVNAGAADKATRDASGNVITSTYATKTEVTSGLSGKLGKTEKASSASTADAVPWTGVSGKPNFATVATTGNYYDLWNRPSIPASPNAYITASSITSTQQAVKFSNGLIIAAGEVNTNRENAVTITFPYAFSNTSYITFVYPPVIDLEDSRTNFMDVYNKDIAYMRISPANNGYKLPSKIWWFVMGI